MYVSYVGKYVRLLNWKQYFVIYWSSLSFKQTNNYKSFYNCFLFAHWLSVFPILSQMIPSCLRSHITYNFYQKRVKPVTDDDILSYTHVLTLDRCSLVASVQLVNCHIGESSVIYVQLMYRHLCIHTCTCCAMTLSCTHVVIVINICAGIYNMYTRTS